MEKVLVVAKTHMGQGKACIGGLSLRTCENVRLLLPGDHNHPAATPFDVGQVWNLELRKVRNSRPPHVEDMVVHAQNYAHSLPSLRDTLLQHIQPWHGGLTQLFDGCLQSDGDKVFISRNGGIPSCSTGYWLTTLPLIRRASAFNKTYYTIQSVVHRGADYYRATFAIAYVGFAEPLAEIPANTLVRVSMCRWFKREEYSEERCYLQISGWYL